ncbi:MAG: 2-amino-4-hydroxy-6-hydroxymethyldihydropteridine diphosphokinase [Chromatiaceae bacterium]|nr:2-amino-4-hydroxy-6-hydroxymethyldihydropteridine diphosphokinase [Gammaproteobacteria bacterium]MCP5301221.1 2-amino-4-hydroxy-6-hydroxymethyldihydropteridine diphosphokinase [Chromatiaceae bacterium]MCP5421307.1 2-amino-4-hydroxy-6-hydroxymethyldihydropteridine diphosphokinase [Chromatiaceae bacterium]
MNGSGESAYIGLGSNLHDPRRQVESALQALDRLPGGSLDARSSLYGSSPLGPPGQPDYVNAVARLHTTLAPLDLLDALQSIEAAQGRRRDMHWGPRTLDLDLLLYGGRRIVERRLVVPHPEMHRRAFVLVPLGEIAPDIDIPGHGPLRELLESVDRSTVRLLRDG